MNPTAPPQEQAPWQPRCSSATAQWPQPVLPYSTAAQALSSRAGSGQAARARGEPAYDDEAHTRRLPASPCPAAHPLPAPRLLWGTQLGAEQRLAYSWCTLIIEGIALAATAANVLVLRFALGDLPKAHEHGTGARRVYVHVRMHAGGRGAVPCRASLCGQ